MKVWLKEKGERVEVITMGLIYITFIVAAALIKAFIVSLAAVGGVFLIISIAWGIYDRVKGGKRK